jgi:XTP/dITP diphosphohydrolase
VCDSSSRVGDNSLPETPESASNRPIRIVLASSNPGKLREYREMAAGSPFQLELLPDFAELPPFDESAPTFAENAAGKALHYSRYTPEIVLADDSGLVVPALGGAPGVHSARHAGPTATDEDRYLKLLHEMTGKQGGQRSARFVCVIALARRGRALTIVSDRAEGLLADEPRGSNGFGYDPIFFFPKLGRTFAEVTPSEKNAYSHRGKAFRKALKILKNSPSAG